MSDNGLENDLFGGSDDGAPPQPPSQVASSSRPSPKPQSGPSTPPAEDGEADEDIGADLFGDDDDDQPPSPRGREGTSPDTPVSLGSSRSPNPLEYAEEDVEDTKPREEHWASVPFPKWNGLKPTDGKVWQLRMPAYVNMESTPYDPVLYRAGLETPTEEEDVNAKRSKMISVRNTVRWKWVTGDDGQPKRQSNSRLLRWSDGSVSLQLGSDLYDLAPSYGTTLARPQDPPPKTPLPDKPPGAQTTFLGVLSTEAEVLMTENTVAGHLSLVPASSSSKTHIELVKHVGQQHVKHSRMKVLEEVVDPEKAHVAVTNARKRTSTRGSNNSGGGGGGGGRARKVRRDSSDDDEDPRYTYDADGPRRGARGGPKGYEAEYDEDDGFVVADTDEDEEAEGEDDEDEDGDGEYGGSRSKSKKSKRKSSSKAKKRKGSEESLDEMEEAERRIEAAEREKKRAKRDKKAKSARRDYDTDEDEQEAAQPASKQPEQDAEGEEDMDMDMDVESE